MALVAVLDGAAKGNSTEDPPVSPQAIHHEEHRQQSLLKGLPSPSRRLQYFFQKLKQRIGPVVKVV
jgi:hypothetical protein